SIVLKCGSRSKYGAVVVVGSAVFLSQRGRNEAIEPPQRQSQLVVLLDLAPCLELFFFEPKCDESYPTEPACDQDADEQEGHYRSWPAPQSLKHHFSLQQAPAPVLPCIRRP